MQNEPLVLGIDPGRNTGYSLTGLDSDETVEVGLLNRGEPFYKERMKRLMERAAYMAIEAQYIRMDKAGGPRRANMQSVQRIIEAKQEAVTLWGEIHPPDNVPLQFQPREWQCAVGIRARGSADCKEASKKIASMLTHRTICSPDMADAVNIGKYAVGQIRAMRLMTKAVARRDAN
jgi:Holliday junction resolvasome RuvABC endonuclease subunit